MAKVSPANFVAQVKQEGEKVTWPTRKETAMSTVMVLVMTSIIAVFFLFVDWAVFSVIQNIMGL